MTDTLERAIARFRPRPAPADDVVACVSAAAFRAMALERLRAVERLLANVWRLRCVAVDTAASRSRLGFALRTVVNGGRLKACSPDGSSEHRAFWREIELARLAYRPNQTMNFYIPPSEGHDDYVMSLALAVEAARDLDLRPHVARGRAQAAALV